MTVDWNLRSVASLATYVNGYPFKPEDHSGEGLPIVRIRQLNDPTAECDYFDGYVPGRNHIRNGDLIFSWSGSLSVGVWDRGHALLNQHLFKVLPNPDVDKSWLRWLLFVGMDLFDPYMHGSAMTHITQPMMRDVKVGLPPLEEQRRIADFLDDQTTRIHKAIQLRQQQVELVQSAVATRELELTWSGLEQEDSAPNGVDTAPPSPAHWRRVRNKNLFRESRARSDQGSEEMLSVSHITGVTPRSEKTVYMFEAETNEGYPKVSPGDLVINTMWAWMGALGVSKYEGIVSPAYGVYTPQVEDYVPEYFDALYRSAPYVCEMTRYSTGVWSSRLRIYPETFLRLPTLLPPVSEQAAIAAEVNRLRRHAQPVIAAIGRDITLLQERKRSLITAAVTGEFDVSAARRRFDEVPTTAGRVHA